MPKAIPMPTYKHETRKPKAFVPPFQNGDKLDQPTFHRLYLTTPDGFKAELIGGIVYMASPVTTFHGLPHGNLCTLLGVFTAGCDGTEMFISLQSLSSPGRRPYPPRVALGVFRCRYPAPSPRTRGKNLLSETARWR
jgi:hypothetical protein